ncbi:hypothetical protein Vi05172_g6513 [Venturia inaequalis]|nr:hypothetical protein Vi05172_g6513 [Venturia inaequalis]
MLLYGQSSNYHADGICYHTSNSNSRARKRTANTITRLLGVVAAVETSESDTERRGTNNAFYKDMESETSIVSDVRYRKAADEATIERRRQHIFGDSDFQWTPVNITPISAAVINSEQLQYNVSDCYNAQRAPSNYAKPSCEDENEHADRNHAAQNSPMEEAMGCSNPTSEDVTQWAGEPSDTTAPTQEYAGRNSAAEIPSQYSSSVVHGKRYHHMPIHHPVTDLTDRYNIAACAVDNAPVRPHSPAKQGGERSPHTPTPHAGRTQEEFAFGNRWLGFPTSRRPQAHRRVFLTTRTEDEKNAMDEWFTKFPDIIGELADTAEKMDRARSLIWTWRHLFITDVRDMPATDLIIHRIPTYEGAVPRIAKPKLYTAEEEDWERKNFSKLEEAGIITRTNSPWSARTKYPRRQNGTLRMVHNFVPINKATIKSNYPMKRIEPILQNIGRPWVVCMFKSDASNGYWAVCTYKKHVYKTAFSSSMGQWAYWRMGQGLTGACGTYAQLKDIVTGSIPTPDPEPALNMAMPGRAVFDHFVDDDIGGADGFDSLYEFLHEHYFPRLEWARLTLNPFKTTFFASKISVLGHEKTRLGIRPSAHKLRAFAQMQSPTSPRELDEFLWQLPFFKWYCPGRSDYSDVMKGALQWEDVVRVTKGKKVKTRDIVGFVWTEACEKAFQACKNAILNNICAAGDPDKQYHVATDASKGGAGGLVFQLLEQPPGTLAQFGKNVLKDMAIIMFMSFKFSDAERRYHTTEREALSVLKCLEECRYLIKGSTHETILYTDHSALISVLQGDDARDRISRWQYRLSEYDLHIVHIPGKDLTVADGLSRLRHGDNADYGPPEPELAALTISTALDETPGVIGDQSGSRRRTGVNVMNELQPEVAMLWREYLDDSWYEEPLTVALGANIPNGATMTGSQRKSIRRFAARLIPYEDDSGPILGYRSNNGKRVRCVLQKEVKATLRTIHDTHTHFANEISSASAVSAYFWPTMLENIEEWCRTCPQCQFLGPLRPTRAILPILTIAPMDLVGMDYVGPMNPIAVSGAKFILIVVDYFTRFVWAKAVPKADSQATSDFLNEIAATFGWPMVAYSDNGSHFRKFCTQTLKKNGTKQIFAPVSHPQSVGLSERYVQAVLAGLRKVLQGDPQRIFKWDEYLPIVIHNLRLRPVRSLGYSPYKLMLGFEPRAHGSEFTIDERIRSAVAATVSEQEMASHVTTAGERAELLKMAKHDEMRDLSTRLRAEQYDKLAQQGGTIQDRRLRKWALPEKGDLVLVRRTYQDHVKGHKLEPKWQGPMKVVSVSWHGQSAVLQNPKTEKKGGRYHLNDLKVFAKRKEEWDLGTDEVVGVNELVRRILLTESVKVKARLMEDVDLDEDEEEMPSIDDTITDNGRNWWNAGGPSTEQQEEEEDSYQGEEIDLSTW